MHWSNITPVGNERKYKHKHIFKHKNKSGKQVFATECNASQSGARNNFRGETLWSDIFSLFWPSQDLHTSVALSLQCRKMAWPLQDSLQFVWSESRSGMCRISYSPHTLFQMKHKLTDLAWLYTVKAWWFRPCKHTHRHILSLVTYTSAERNAPWVRSDDDVLCIVCVCLFCSVSSVFPYC